MRLFYSGLIIVCFIICFLSFHFSGYMQYDVDEELANFPIPIAAKLEQETNESKHFQWSRATGTDIPISYKWAIRHAGFKRVQAEGQLFQFEKDQYLVTLIPSTDFMEVLVEKR